MRPHVIAPLLVLATMALPARGGAQEGPARSSAAGFSITTKSGSMLGCSICRWRSFIAVLRRRELLNDVRSWSVGDVSAK